MIQLTEVKDTVTVGLTEQTHRMLQQLKKDGVFAEMRDGYLLGIALAISDGIIAPEDIKTGTVFNVGSLDPDNTLRDVITELYPEAAGRPYAYAERLAEAGVAEIGRLHRAGEVRFGELFDLAGER